MLTDAQLTDVRRFMGYPLVGTTMQITNDQDTVYGYFGLVVMSLHQRLTSLSASEEAVVVNTYLTNLYTLEGAIPAAGENLDTAEAAVWVHNSREQADREKLFDSWRRRLCGFIGFVPGPDLGPGGLSIGRA
ncbi:MULTISPECIES: hypothetical protein [unclassified Cupriavidus]|uniref:hypothetical protein n=1 Tax=unclassified Cupriavidus TaxID=2640874 RepID=UPI001C0069C8|nr:MULTISPECIES: hypothetical protein [unclassified Cupriavidus]MCA3183915.1 hypothetical protein [Cupriavidus sp.]MCA3194323.1 hypothetical protein [Cupriavidus sp.]MCA3200431.1 hypothetical protein [Cupriavidus sp.]MCA3233697.1 hypothetical protein [Cupriavidus sp.]QWE95332.1 hypothetical protein KLP38_05400 [Cupriavidus sp. EM10]